MITVAIVDDQPLLVSAFSALIDHEDDMEVVATATDGWLAVRACAEHRPDVVLMDIRMPRMDGIEATRRIVDAGHGRVLVLTTFDIDDLVLGALAAGARGFLLKDAEPAEVIDAIRAIHRGEAVIATQVAPAVLATLHRPAGDTAPGGETGEPTDPDPLIATLTAREVEVLRLIARGRTNAEIGEELFVALTTVKTHVGNLLLKLDARDRVALVVLAHSVGLVGSDDPPRL